LPRFTAEAAVRVLEQQRVTLTNLIPTMLARVLAEPALARADRSSLRLVLTGGAPIAPAVVRRTMEALGCEYAQTYGMTETSPYLTLGLLPPHLAALPFEEQLVWRAKTGRPFAAVELRVVGEDGEPVPADGVTVGEIQARGPTVTPGYWRDEEATRAAFDGAWLKTGDLSVVDSEGFLDIVGRRKEMIITGGEKVFPVEVERALYAHADVLEAAVYGVPDAEWGESVEAAVAPRPGRELDAEALRDHCRAELAAYKVPKRIRVLGELPRLGSGKIAKQELAQAARSICP
jgi:acyl-CoA synthetase (AMP-forming)/AMP-acid ligase II